MTKLRNNSVYLKHIRDAISEIENYLANISEDEFKNNSLFHSATIRQLEVIGEAAKNIDRDFQAKHPSIPWPQMARMRDRLIHHYFGVDLSVVWIVAEKELPELKNKIIKLITDESHTTGLCK